MPKLFKIKLKARDKVVVLSGKYKGQTGKVVRVHPKLNKVTVEGINVVKKHNKRTRESAGGITEITKPIWASKVAIFEPLSKKPSRLGAKVSSTGLKTRVYKSSGKEIK